MLFIGTPCLESVNWQYHMALVNLITYLTINKVDHKYSTVVDCNLPKSRAELVTTALLHNASHLLFIDSDIVFKPEDVMRLLSHDLPIVAGVYTKRKIVWDYVKAAILKGDPKFACRGEYTFIPKNTTLTKDDVIKQTVIPAKYIPTGFLMMKTEVFKQMNERYPELKYKSKQTDEAYALFDYLIDDDGQYLTEDFSFCKRANECGIPIYVDLAIKLEHVGLYNFPGDPLTCLVPKSQLGA